MSDTPKATMSEAKCEVSEEQVRSLWTLVMGQSIDAGCDAIRQALAQEAQRANERAEGLAAQLERANESARLLSLEANEQTRRAEGLAEELEAAKAQADRDAREIDALDSNGDKAEQRAEGSAKELAEARAALDEAHFGADAATARVAELEGQMATHSARGCTCADTSPEYCPICADRIQDLEKQLADKEAEGQAELARLRALPGGDKPLVYLACPYTHKDRAVRVSRFNAANEAASKLMLAGEFVFSPISHTHPIAEAGGLPLGWDFWEGFDRAYIGHSKKLIVLRVDGWAESTGVRAEIAIAQEARIPVEYIDPAEGHPAPLPSAQQIPAPAKALAPDPAPQATPEAEGRSATLAQPLQDHPYMPAPMHDSGDCFKPLDSGGRCGLPRAVHPMSGKEFLAAMDGIEFHTDDPTPDQPEGVGAAKMEKP